jgi:hypothetical protein
MKQLFRRRKKCIAKKFLLRLEWIEEIIKIMDLKILKVFRDLCGYPSPHRTRPL